MQVPPQNQTYIVHFGIVTSFTATRQADIQKDRQEQTEMKADGQHLTDALCLLAVGLQSPHRINRTAIIPLDHSQ